MQVCSKMSQDNAFRTGPYDFGPLFSYICKVDAMDDPRVDTRLMPTTAAELLQLMDVRAFPVRRTVVKLLPFPSMPLKCPCIVQESDP